MPKKTKTKPLEGEFLEATKAGRPVEFTPEHLKLLQDVMRNGGKTVSRICSALKICRDTHYRWKQDYPEYAAAYSQGLDDAQSYHERVIQGLATGEIKGNGPVAMYMMNNLYREDWKPNSVDGTNVNINVTANLSEDKLDALIKAKEEAIKKLGTK